MDIISGETETTVTNTDWISEAQSTEGQLTIIAQETDNAFQEKKKVVSVFSDLTKALDKVWREGLLL